MCAYLGAAQHHRSGGHECAFAHFGVIHHDGAHSYQGVIVDFGAVDNHVVAYGDIVADFDYRFMVKSVKHAAVLDVDAVADTYGVDVAAQHGSEPDAALVAHLHVAYYGAVVGQETVFPYLGCKSSYCLYKCHIICSLRLGYQRVSSLVFSASHAASSALSSGVRRSRTSR